MNALRGGYRLTRFLYRHREPVVLVGSAALLWVVMDALADRRRVGILGLLLLAAMFWSYFQPGADARRLRSRWRKRWVYQRQWFAVLNLAGLVPNGVVPALRRVRSSAAQDVVTVRMARGQVLADWTSRAERLADGFGAVACWAEPGRRRRTVRLAFTRPGVRTFPADGRW